MADKADKLRQSIGKLERQIADVPRRIEVAKEREKAAVEERGKHILGFAADEGGAVRKVTELNTEITRAQAEVGILEESREAIKAELLNVRIGLLRVLTEQWQLENRKVEQAVNELASLLVSRKGAATEMFELAQTIGIQPNMQIPFTQLVYFAQTKVNSIETPTGAKPDVWRHRSLAELDCEIAMAVEVDLQRVEKKAAQAAERAKKPRSKRNPVEELATALNKTAVRVDSTPWARG